jgi:Arc/MetJ-type ribon-helix-helix transcriptional regulator
MKKKLYTRPVSIVMPEKMFEQISELTDQQEISISDYIREALQEKLSNEIATTKED